MLCTPRVVTRKHAAELTANIARCNAGKPCPQPLCRPPAHDIAPSCQSGRCVARTSTVPRD